MTTTELASGPAVARTRPGRRIGVFGGTFDPPHIGHLVTALEVRHVFDLALVLMVVANEPWQKVGTRSITPAADRLAMVRAAVSGDPGIEASDIELARGGPSYTVDTLEELLRIEPTAALHLIVGSDSAAQLHTWERSEALSSLCRLVVVERPGSTTEVPGGFEFDRVEVPRLEVSSTDLRERVRDGRPLRYLIPDEVISLMRRDGLYGDRR